MMDNSQGSDSVKEVNSEVKSEQVFEAKAEVTQEVKEVKEEKRVPLHELYKERNRRKAAEEELGKLRTRMDELDTKFSKVSQMQDDDELVTEAEKDLGIDKESAKKLLNLQRKVAERAAPKQTQTTINDPVLQAMDGFKKRASEASQDYEDWNEMIPAMQAIMSKEIEQNGLGAYNKSPEYYYSKALRAQRESEQRVKKEDIVDKSNTTQMATSESGSSSSGRSASTKITQAVWDANRTDVKWVRENESEIKQLWRQGKLK
jgi:hypothetical protein